MSWLEIEWIGGEDERKGNSKRMLTHHEGGWVEGFTICWDREETLTTEHWGRALGLDITTYFWVGSVGNTRQPHFYISALLFPRSSSPPTGKPNFCILSALLCPYIEPLSSTVESHPWWKIVPPQSHVLRPQLGTQWAHDPHAHSQFSSPSPQ